MTRHVIDLVNCPGLDHLPGGGWLVAALEVEKTELWALDLIYTE